MCRTYPCVHKIQRKPPFGKKIVHNISFRRQIYRIFLFGHNICTFSSEQNVTVISFGNKLYRKIPFRHKLHRAFLCGHKVYRTFHVDTKCTEHFLVDTESTEYFFVDTNSAAPFLVESNCTHHFIVDTKFTEYFYITYSYENKQHRKFDPGRKLYRIIP